MFRILTLIIVLFYFNLVKTECVDYTDSESCLIDCDCAWCFWSYKSDLRTACIKDDKSIQFCQYWNATVRLAKETEHCKQEAKTEIILEFIPLGFLIVGIIILVLYFVYCHRRREPSAWQSQSIDNQRVRGNYTSLH